MAKRIISISGVSSNSGKTTLLCDLLSALSANDQWEAIKLTRGHYRSCGKDPHACCVSDLLDEKPLVRSGREETYGFGKDTGRYWEAGATNVHWVIVTDDQVEAGINEALRRVKTDKVLIEGTSLLKYIKPDSAVMVVRSDHGKIKPSARRALSEGKIDAIFCSDDPNEFDLAELPRELIGALPIYTRADLPQLIDWLRQRGNNETTSKQDAVRSSVSDHRIRRVC